MRMATATTTTANGLARQRARREARAEGARTVALGVVVLLVLWALWEGYKWIGERLEITWPFPVNELTMPHVHDMVLQLFEPSRRNGPLLIETLGHAAAFTAKEAATGFLLGAS